MPNYLFIFDNFSWSDTLDIVLVFMIFYFIYMKVSKTKILPVLQTFMIILLITFLSNILGLTTIHYILQNVVSLMFIAALILFPIEIKRGLYKIGEALFQKFMYDTLDDSVINNILKSVSSMSRNKVGAIIIFTGNDNLVEISNTGIIMNAHVEKKLILTIFNKKSLLHDGAIIISHNRITAASCFIPQLSSSIDNQKNLGTRHLASLGLSEVSDALMVIVSEENGKISIARKSKLTYGVGLARLKMIIKGYYDVSSN